MSQGNPHSEVLQRCVEWLERGHRVALATVVQAWGSAPRPPGSMAAIRDDGVLFGSVSGGCIEEDLMEKMRSSTLPALPEILNYGISDEMARSRQLPCGGALLLVFEPAPRIDLLRTLLERIEHGEILARQLDLDTGEVIMKNATAGEETIFDGRFLTTVHGACWQLYLIGAGQLSRRTAELAMLLDYRVVVCDPRSEYAGTWDLPGTELVTAMPDELLAERALNVRSAVVALTHDPRIDDLALLEALKSDAFYVGALGSKNSNAKRRERLAQFDLTPKHLGRLHGPVGLPIGGRTPGEIALSILAEMTAVRHGVQLQISAPVPSAITALA